MTFITSPKQLALILIGSWGCQGGLSYYRSDYRKEVVDIGLELTRLGTHFYGVDMTIREAAKVLGVKYDTFYRRVRVNPKKYGAKKVGLGKGVWVVDGRKVK
jgi:hypothetical protein